MAAESGCALTDQTDTADRLTANCYQSNGHCFPLIYLMQSISHSVRKPFPEDAKSQAIAKLLPSSRKLLKKPKSAQVTNTPSAPVRDQAYISSLKLNRNYEELMKTYQNGAPPVSDPPLQGEDLFAKDEEAERNKREDRARLRKTVKKVVEASKTSREEKVWCAHCNTKHTADYHRQQQRAPKRSPLVPQRDIFAPPSSSSEDSGSDMEDFIVQDGEAPQEAVSSTIRKLFKYDPKKYAGRDDDDPTMEVGYDHVLKAERQTARIGRMEDAREFELTKRRKY